MQNVNTQNVEMQNVNTQMDGYMLMQQVRALSPAQGGQVKAIALTAYAGDINYQQAMAAGFQLHLSKPVKPEKLLQAIARLFHTSSAAASSIMPQ
nr:response regulator [Fortiea contorta]